MRPPICSAEGVAPVCPNSPARGNMSNPPLLLDKGGTTSPRKLRTSTSLVWEAVLTRLKVEGREEECRALGQCGLGIRGTFGVQFGWPNSPCGRWICPACNHRKSAERQRAYIPQISAAMGGNGGCGGLTLTRPPEGTAKEGLARLRGAMDKIRDMATWKKKLGGWSQKLGVLAIYEAAKGSQGQVHPHLHLAVFGPNRREVHECLLWLCATWLCLNPDASPECQVLSAVHGAEGPWRKWVAYVLKGTRIDPGWPRETLCGVLDLFPPGSRHCTSWGRYRLARNTPKPSHGALRG